ncbi:MAG: GNAT family N-acetyltransferase [Alphaproteobacteria bacterium]|nr:GNAT family N-acetyltransferase [Alphaproteobacteria bacterium]
MTILNPNREDGERGNAGLEVRLAENPQEITAALELRYRIFYDEMKARPTEVMLELRRDFDEYDQYCDHLLLLDHRLGSGGKAVVGTYRLIPEAVAKKIGRFYSSSEFDLGLLRAYPKAHLELGRSCIEKEYRQRNTMLMIWAAIAQYVNERDIGLMFGCASLGGTDPTQLKLPLSYLYYYHLAPPALRVRALPERRVEMQILPQEEVILRTAVSELPPLLKGYLRLGGFVGDGAVVDEQFNTTDVLIMVKSDLINEQYALHFERRANPSGMVQPASD